MPTTATPSCAITFSGWLNVAIPGDGREARRFLVDPLGADVFVAGTYRNDDCAVPTAGPGAAPDGQCLLPKLRNLQPLTGVRLTPMLTHDQMVRYAHSAPAFERVAKGLKVEETFQGLNLFAPVDLHSVWDQ